MSQRNSVTSLIPKVLFGLAIIGFVIIAIKFQFYGRLWRPSHVYLFHTQERLNGFAFVLLFGVALLLPFLIYLTTVKTRPKTKLKGNRRNSDKNENDEARYRQSIKRKASFEIYVLNKSTDALIVNRDSVLEHNQWHIFQMNPSESLYFSNGVIFNFYKDYTLEIIDSREQIIGLGEDCFIEYGVPDYVDWAFIIAKPQEGNIAQIEKCL